MDLEKLQETLLQLKAQQEKALKEMPEKKMVRPNTTFRRFKAELVSYRFESHGKKQGASSHASEDDLSLPD